MSYPAIKRPNGKLYRPRKIVAEFFYEDEIEAGIWVFGTHDGSLSRKLASDLLLTYDKGLMATSAYTLWVSRVIRNGTVMYEQDDEHGRAAVCFPELAEVPYAPSFVWKEGQDTPEMTDCEYASMRNAESGGYMPESPLRGVYDVPAAYALTTLRICP